MDGFRKSGKKKNFRGGHFGEVLDELLNKICFPLRFCINNAYVNGKPCLYILISNRYDLLTNSLQGTLKKNQELICLHTVK